MKSPGFSRGEPLIVLPRVVAAREQVAALAPDAFDIGGWAVVGQPVRYFDDEPKLVPSSAVEAPADTS